MTNSRDAGGSKDSTDRHGFQSPRLRAEPVRADHAPLMARVLADPRIHRYLDGGPPTEAELVRRYTFLEGRRSPDGREHWLRWILFPLGAEGAHGGAADAEMRPPIGFIEATVHEPEWVCIAYVLHPDAWRRGFAREAIVGMLDLVFARHDVERAVAEMDTENAGSIALAESLGMRRTGTIDVTVERHGVPPRPAQEHRYEMEREQWQRQRTGGGSAASRR